MVFETRQIRKLLAAETAQVAALFSVNPLMFCKTVAAFEPIIAVFALIWTLARVKTFMFCEVCLLCEPFVAN